MGFRAVQSCLLLAVALSLFAGVAHAEPSAAEHRQAQALFERGRVLLEQDKYEEACAAFAESQRLDPGGGTLLNLALCHEKQGRIATAYTEYQEALSGALSDKRRDREDFARAHLAGLEGKIPRLHFELESQEPRVTIELDGSELSEIAWSTPTPIDPGEHRVVVSAPGHQSWQSSIEVPAAGRELVVKIPKLERLPPTAPQSPKPVAPAATAAPPPKDVSTAPPPTEASRSTAFWVVGGVGVAALAVSAVTGVLALDADSAAEERMSAAGCVTDRGFCRDTAALADSRAESDRARTLAWVSTGTLVLGGGAILTALLLPRQQEPRETATLRLAPAVAPRQVSLSVSRAW